MIRYKITLEKEEREKLEAIINNGHHSSKDYQKAAILLNSDEGEYSEKSTNVQISKILKVGLRKIDRVKKKFVLEGFEAVFEKKKPNREYEKKIDGDVEAHLVTLCCSNPPEGFARWSLRVLSDKMVELNYIASVYHETVRQALKKTNLNRGKNYNM